MKACSISAFTVCCICLRMGSSCMVSSEPPRESSHAADHGIFPISLPVIWETGRAVGRYFESLGAASRLSYS